MVGEGRDTQARFPVTIPYASVFKNHSWQLLKGPYLGLGIKPKPVAFKTNTFLHTLPLWLLNIYNKSEIDRTSGFS